MGFYRFIHTAKVVLVVHKIISLGRIICNISSRAVDIRFFAFSLQFNYKIHSNGRK